MADKAKDKKLTFAEMTALVAGELHKIAKTVVSPFKRFENTKAEIADNLQFAGKVTAAMKRAHQAELLDPASKLPKDMPFKKGKNGKRPGYFDMHAGGELPPRIEALAELFNTLVLGLGGKPLITEEDYDNCAYSWLEKANPIINAALKEHGDNWKGCDDVLDVINVLSKRPADGLKKLNAIRKRQKGIEDGDGEEAPEGESADTSGKMVPLTVGRAVEFLKAAIATAGKMPERAAAEMYVEIMQLGGEWTAEITGLAQETLDQWNDNMSAGRHPLVSLEPAAQAA